MAKKPIVNVEDVGAVGATVLAESIVKLSAAGEQLLSSGLSMRAITLLLKDRTGVGLGECEAVLRALPDLARLYAPGRPKK